jgi:L,D-transpeptidase-like protein
MSLKVIVFLAVLLVAGVALLFWERDPSPAEALSQMKQQVERSIARSEAELYAPAAATAVRDSFAALESLFQAQKGRLPFLRNWSQVRAGLGRMEGLLRQMELAAKQSKEALRASLQEDIAAGRAEADGVEAEIATAPRSKDSRGVLLRLRTALQEVRARIDKAQAALDAGQFISAREEIDGARASLATLRQEVQEAKERARELGMGSPTRSPAVLVVDVSEGRFTLLGSGRSILRTGPCATGSGETVHGPGGRTWTFDTPQGLRRVHHKAPRPIWYKPDWAYIEAGLSVPPAGAPERWERGMLGAYALDIGGGYLVHGSPYAVVAGERSTHGCVRLAEADLEVVYQTLQIGDVVLLR